MSQAFHDPQHIRHLRLRQPFHLHAVPLENFPSLKSFVVGAEVHNGIDALEKLPQAIDEDMIICATKSLEWELKYYCKNHEILDEQHTFTVWILVTFSWC